MKYTPKTFSDRRMNLVLAMFGYEGRVVLAIPFRVVRALMVFHINLPDLSFGVFWEACLHYFTGSNLSDSLGKAEDLPD